MDIEFSERFDWFSYWLIDLRQFSLDEILKYL